MRLLIFLHGTVIMHRNAVGKTCNERVQQVINGDESIYDFSSYVPIGKSNQKLSYWALQDVEITYLSSNKNLNDISNDIMVLKKYDFPEGKVQFRQNGESYKNIAETYIPDILIEDDCQSIGGLKEMVYPHIEESLKTQIKSIVLPEFFGIDDLPDSINELLTLRV